MMITRGEGGGREVEKNTGTNYVVTEGDETLGGEHTMEYTNVVF